jgi:hypothetical protein
VRGSHKPKEQMAKHTSSKKLLQDEAEDLELDEEDHLSSSDTEIDHIISGIQVPEIDDIPVREKKGDHEDDDLEPLMDMVFSKRTTNMKDEMWSLNLSIDEEIVEDFVGK